MVFKHNANNDSWYINSKKKKNVHIVEKKLKDYFIFKKKSNFFKNLFC